MANWIVRLASRARRAGRGADDARARGRCGEDRAVAALVADGCRIIARNRRIAGVEVDVLAVDPVGDLLLVVEVKASADGRPAARRVDMTRRRRLVRAATMLGRTRTVAIEIAEVDLRAPFARSVRRIRLESCDVEAAVRGRRVS